MEIAELIKALGYDANPNFITGDALASAVDYAHVFRRGVERVGLRGVYSLRQPAPDKSNTESLIPAVYVCAAKDENEARIFQKLVWNQNVAPFVIIHTPTRIRLFSGFAYAENLSGPQKTKGLSSPLDLSVEFNQIDTVLASFEANSIDDGTLWQDFGKYVDPKKRVDWELLQNLEELDAALIGAKLDWQVSHALIGNYVYLNYLRQRKILSPHRLAEAGVEHDQVFSGNATKTALVKLLDYLNGWLNGSVYPLEWTRDTAPRQEHVRLVAAVFAGETVDGQMHLPFDRYDFSVIPVETISSIYEFFLHAHDPKNKKTSAERLGAYYTPVPLVNFMLDELERHVPMGENTTCFDASCGSGAFLVQCYRRMIERRVRADGANYRQPSELRKLLQERVFGVDRDGDACRVTELSLILTLLDYVDPPDLAPVHNFKLPKLHNHNIFETDFFKSASAFTDVVKDRQFDWVVGNPPWVELKPPKIRDDDSEARAWISENKEKKPTGGNQLAEAFLWKVTDHLSYKGGAAMLVPAMTLFKDESTAFRRQFFGELNVWTVANFANMAEVLFAGRSRVPAAAIFYSIPRKDLRPDNIRESIVTYSPLVCNQSANRPDSPGRQKDTWSITIADSETREISSKEAKSGDRVPWKTAMWGSHLDLRFLQRLMKRFGLFGDICGRLGIHIHQGLELRCADGSTPGKSSGKKESVLAKPELVGKLKLGSEGLRNTNRIYVFPSEALKVIPKEHAYVREGRFEIPMLVSESPHVIVDATRRFAVFEDRFIAVPPRQIGIGGKNADTDLLKAMSLFLSSDFTIYHQFLMAPSWGIHVSRADRETLVNLPFPLKQIEQSGLKEWAKLHAALVTASTEALSRTRMARGPLFDQADRPGEILRLETEVNDRVAVALGLRQWERSLINDLVHVRMRLIQGKVDAAATRAPVVEDMKAYARVLKTELDTFIKVATTDRHTIDVIHHSRGTMIVIRRGAQMSSEDSLRVQSADAETARPLMAMRQRLLKKHSQWVYFDRSLRIHKPDATYLFKPMQFFHWLKSQALIDAGEIIADRAGAGKA